MATVEVPPPSGNGTMNIPLLGHMGNSSSFATAAEWLGKSSRAASFNKPSIQTASTVTSGIAEEKKGPASVRAKDIIL
jgi:hypothetical protein